MLLALYTFSQSVGSDRQRWLTALIVVSRVELAGFLFFRVLVRGKDERFDAIRNNTAVRGDGHTGTPTPSFLPPRPSPPPPRLIFPRECVCTCGGGRVFARLVCS